MKTRPNILIPTVLLAALLGTAGRPAAAQQFTIDFENATNIPNQAGPSTANSSNTFQDAFGGLDTVHGVTFSDEFVVFRDSYTNGVGGDDLFGTPHGTFALANTAGGGDADTGPGDAGLDDLVFTTNAVLTSAYFGSVDYGNDSFGADQVTVFAVGKSGDLGSVSLDLNTSTPTLTKMDTSSFLSYTGQITGYRISRDLGAYGAFGGGGNYQADDFTFTAAPEPGAPIGLGIGLLTLAVWVVAGRRTARHSHTAPEDGNP